MTQYSDRDNAGKTHVLLVISRLTVKHKIFTDVKLSFFSILNFSQEEIFADF